MLRSFQIGLSLFITLGLVSGGSAFAKAPFSTEDLQKIEQAKCPSGGCTKGTGTDAQTRVNNNTTNTNTDTKIPTGDDANRTLGGRGKLCTDALRTKLKDRPRLVTDREKRIARDCKFEAAPGEGEQVTDPGKAVTDDKNKNEEDCEGTPSLRDPRGKLRPVKIGRAKCGKASKDNVCTDVLKQKAKEHGADLTTEEEKSATTCKFEVIKTCEILGSLGGKKGPHRTGAARKIPGKIVNGRCVANDGSTADTSVSTPDSSDKTSPEVKSALDQASEAVAKSRSALHDLAVAVNGKEPLTNQSKQIWKRMEALKTKQASAQSTLDAAKSQSDATKAIDQAKEAIRLSESVQAEVSSLKSAVNALEPVAVANENIQARIAAEAQIRHAAEAITKLAAAYETKEHVSNESKAIAASMAALKPKLQGAIAKEAAGDRDRSSNLALSTQNYKSATALATDVFFKATSLMGTVNGLKTPAELGLQVSVEDKVFSYQNVLDAFCGVHGEGGGFMQNQDIVANVVYVNCPAKPTVSADKDGCNLGGKKPIADAQNLWGAPYQRGSTWYVASKGKRCKP